MPPLFFYNQYGIYRIIYCNTKATHPRDEVIEKQFQNSEHFCSCLIGECDFEQHGFCEWLQVKDGDDDFDWLLNQGETSSKETGPNGDHTTDSKQGMI